MIEYWALRSNPPTTTSTTKGRAMPYHHVTMPKRGRGGRFVSSRRSNPYSNPTGYPLSGSAYRPRISRASSGTAQLAARHDGFPTLLLGERAVTPWVRAKAGASRQRKAAARVAAAPPRRAAAKTSRPRAPSVVVVTERVSRARPARAPKQLPTTAKPKKKKGRRGDSRQTTMFSENPPRRGGDDGPMGVYALLRVDTWVQAGTGVVGFGGALMLPMALAQATGKPQIGTGGWGVGLSALSAVAIGALGGVVSPRAGRNLFVGGMIATGVRLVVTIWPGIASAFSASAPSLPMRSSAPPGAPSVKGMGADDYLMIQQQAKSLQDQAAALMVRAAQAPGSPKETAPAAPAGEGRRRRRQRPEGAADYVNTDPGVGDDDVADYVDVQLHGADEDMDDYVNTGVGGDDDMDGADDDLGAVDYLTAGEGSSYSAREVL